MKIRKVRIHRFGGPEVLQVDGVEPSQPAAAQVLITVKAASINPVDYKIRSGTYPAVNSDEVSNEGAVIPICGGFERP